MDPESRAVWELVRRQHGVVAKWQLLELGYGRDAIAHRVAKGRLHRVFPHVLAAGRPRLTQHGRWMAAVLSCGPDAALSHEAAGGLWQLTPERRGPIDISVRRASVEVTWHHGIPVTTT